MKEYTLKELAELTSSKILGDSSYIITGINVLEDAKENELSFLANPKYIDLMKKSKSKAICISNQDENNIEVKKNYLVSKDPSRTFQTILEIFLTSNDFPYSGFDMKIHETAVIHQNSKICENVTISANSVIDKNANIEKNTFIGANVYIGQNVKIGKDCIIHPSVVIREGCVLKDRVIIQPGAVIGSCGFGYTQKDNKFVKLAQIGNVIIEDDVEIGANATIDRARIKSTIIRKGAKIDNLVQIAHNVEIGENNAIAAQTGIAGSTKTGKNILMGGQVGIVGHVEVCDNVMLATRSGVSKSIKKPGKYRGSPVADLEEYNRQKVHLRRIEKYYNLIKNLKEKILEIEEKLKVFKK